MLKRNTGHLLLSVSLILLTSQCVTNARSAATPDASAMTAVVDAELARRAAASAAAQPPPSTAPTAAATATLLASPSTTPSRLPSAALPTLIATNSPAPTLPPTAIPTTTPTPVPTVTATFAPEGDRQAPTIVSITVSPATVAAGSTVTITARVQDKGGSGTRSVGVCYHVTFVDIQGCVVLQLSAGTPQDGTWSRSVTVAVGVPSGAIEPDVITVFDGVGNQTNYFPGGVQTYNIGLPFTQVLGDLTAKQATIVVR